MSITFNSLRRNLFEAKVHVDSDDEVDSEWNRSDYHNWIDESLRAAGFENIGVGKSSGPFDAKRRIRLARNLGANSYLVCDISWRFKLGQRIAESSCNLFVTEKLEGHQVRDLFKLSMNTSRQPFTWMRNASFQASSDRELITQVISKLEKIKASLKLFQVAQVPGKLMVDLLFEQWTRGYELRAFWPDLVNRFSPEVWQELTQRVATQPALLSRLMIILAEWDLPSSSRAIRQLVSTIVRVASVSTRMSTAYQGYYEDLIEISRRVSNGDFGELTPWVKNQVLKLSSLTMDVQHQSKIKVALGA